MSAVEVIALLAISALMAGSYVACVVAVLVMIARAPVRDDMEDGRD